MRRTLLAAVALALVLGTTAVASAAVFPRSSFPARIVDVSFSTPGGISYDPKAPIEITLTLLNPARNELDLRKAEWRVTRTRALPAPRPEDPWDVTLADVEDVATGTLESPEGFILARNQKRAVKIKFTPGKYGHYSVRLRYGLADLKSDWFRAVAAAVVYEPAPGFKPLSPCMPNYNEMRADKGDYRWLGIASRYGIKWVRGNLVVRAVPGKPGEFDWSEAEKMAQALRNNHVLLLGDLGEFPGMTVPRLGDKPITYWAGAKANLVPVPESFDKLADYVQQVLKRFGDVMPAAYVRNEPWELGSISNYRASGAYYRQLLQTVYKAAHAAKPDVLILANDQITNFEDNIQSVEGMTAFVDATSHHTGWTDNRGAVQSAAIGKPAWETQDWASHYDAYVVASMTMKLAGGYTKTNPTTDSGYLFSVGREHMGSAYDNDSDFYSPSAIGQALSTWLHFIEDTDFAGRVHPATLPRILLFKGRAPVQKHVAVVIGRIKAYGALYKKDEGDVDWPQITTFGELRLDDKDATLSVCDISGNPLKRTDNRFDIPLTEEPYYVVSSRGLDDCAARLRAATARYEGNVFHTSLQDFTRPVADKPPVRVTVTCGIQAKMGATVALTPPDGWKLEPREIKIPALAPGQSHVAEFKVVQAVEKPANQYPFTVSIASDAGLLEFREVLHAAVFRKATITVDGQLADWEKAGAVPVLLSAQGMIVAEKVENPWQPLASLKTADPGAIVARFAGLWDDKFLYVAAEVRDPAGELRPSMAKGTYYLMHGNPFDYLYWWGPTVPGTRGCGLKIAIDLRRPGDKLDRWIPAEYQRRFEGWGNHLSADYEYDLYLGQQNVVREKYAAIVTEHLGRLANPFIAKIRGGWPPFDEPTFMATGEPLPELWRLMTPGLARGNYYPFTPRPRRDQSLLEEAALVVKRTEAGWLYEAAIPWEELAEVRPAAGKEIRFSFYVLSAGQRALSWTTGRSACRGFQILHPTWITGDAIETVWGFAE